MRSLSLMLLVSMLAVGIATASTASATTTTTGAGGASVLTQSSTQPVDQHDGSRVGVQLIVAGMVAGLVVGVGSGGYLLRRKLGRTAYSPDTAGGDGHH
jgi:hypothetical protein